MPELYYIGLDVHKKTITYRIKRKDGTLVARGTIEATRAAHQRGYFHAHLDSLRHTPESVIELLAITRSSLEMFDSLQQQLLRGLERHPLLQQRVERPARPNSGGAPA